MKTKNLLGILWLAVCSIINLTSCDKAEKTAIFTPFHMEKETYEVMQNGTNKIYIANGSGHVILSVENTDIVSATLQKDIYADGLLAVIQLNGLRKGETTLHVTDHITKETEALQIKVTDRYLVFNMGESNHPALTQNPGMVMYLIDNEARDCYFFSLRNSPDKSPDALLSKGNYLFSVGKQEEATIPYLTLTYISDEKGNFTDAAIAPTAHTFDLSKSSDVAYSILETYLNFNWQELTQDATTKNSPPPLPTFRMHEVDTEYAITGIIDREPLIPEGFLE